MADLFVRGLVAHLIGDWFLQNAWIAAHKVKLYHPAAWLHGGIHFGLLYFVFPWQVALLVALTHWVIDGRVFLAAWRRLLRQTTEGEAALHVAIWQDQAAHIVWLWIAADAVAGGAWR